MVQRLRACLCELDGKHNDSWAGFLKSSSNQRRNSTVPKGRTIKKEANQMRTHKIITAIVTAICLGLSAGMACADSFPIVIGDGADTRTRWAGAELSKFLKEMHPDDRFPVVDSVPEKGDFIALAGGDGVGFDKARAQCDELDEPGEFSVSQIAIGARQVGMICGNDSRAVLDGVYALLEQKLGYGFYLYRNASEGADQGPFTFSKWDLRARPLVQERLCFNWYNFISGVSAWNIPDYKKWIRQAARMRHTDVMLHSYGWGPFTQFTYNGVTKSVGYLQNTELGDHWGNMHTADVRQLLGGESLVDEGPIFGAEVSKVGHGGITEGNRVAKAKALLREAVDYAVNSVGMEFNWSFDIDTIDGNPQDIIATLPESARFKVGDNWLARPDTEAGYRFFRKIIETTMKDYPALTKITVWWRHKNNTAFGGLSLTMKSAELPAEWRTIYEAAPVEARNAFGPGHLYHAGVARALRRALDELGHTKVKLGYGSWWMEDRHESLLSANHFMPREMTCYALDYHMAFGERRDYRDQLAKVADDRPLVVIEWAHHDDGGYLGRPYLPPENFATKLKQTGCSGYGVIHWMTRPLDVFFKNLQNQVWSNTTNETIERTCEKMAVDFFGKSQSVAMTEYLKAWMTTAPQFGRETGSGLGKPGSVGNYGSVKNHDERAAACDERIAMLDRVDTAKLSPQALEAWEYFRGHEEWIKLFHLAQKNWDRPLQEKTIQKYIEKSSHDGGMTRGEMGILIQHHLKWLKNTK